MGQPDSHKDCDNLLPQVVIRLLGCGLECGLGIHSTETIQVVLDSELLRATEGVAKRARVNRSAPSARHYRDGLSDRIRKFAIA